MIFLSKYQPDARNIALKILNALNSEYQTIDRVFEQSLSVSDPLPDRDRAFVNALVYGVLRWRGRLDYFIKHFSNVKFSKIKPEVVNIIRLGLFQMMYLSRVPDSAAVNTSVNLAKNNAAPWIVKYVNAVLRNASRSYQDVPFPSINKDPVKSIAAENSFPEWLIRKWSGHYNIKEIKLICKAINTIPSITLRVNSLKTEREKIIQRIESEVKNAIPTDFSPHGILIKNPRKPIPTLQGFRDGFFQVQDEAAQLVTFLLGSKPGDTVLDACSGHGGKTGHIAAQMKNSGKIIALDNNNKKLIKLMSEMDRLSVSIVSPYYFDLNHPVEDKDLRGFDRVFLDAPCSGLGVIRRNPDIKWKTSRKNLKRYKEKQILFLKNLAPVVKSGGILLYTVCTTEPEENEEVVTAFLKEHTGFIHDKNFGMLPENARSLVNEHGFFKTYPHIHNMDGFFSARLKRIK